MLSQKVIEVFKSQGDTGSVQINKDAKSAVVERVREFLSTVLTNCEELVKSGKRKTYDLQMVVNASCQALRATKVDMSDFLSYVFATKVEAKNLYTSENLPAVGDMYKEVTTKNGKKMKRRKTLNTLQLTEIEDMFETTRKAARDANVFLSRSADYVALNILKTATAKVLQQKRKRIVESDIGTVGATLVSGSSSPLSGAVSAPNTPSPPPPEGIEADVASAVPTPPPPEPDVASAVPTPPPPEPDADKTGKPKKKRRKKNE